MLEASSNTAGYYKKVYGIIEKKKKEAIIAGKRYNCGLGTVGTVVDDNAAPRLRSK